MLPSDLRTTLLPPPKPANSTTQAPATATLTLNSNPDLEPLLLPPQGTACITLAGLLSAARLTGKTLNQHRILFLGAGEAGTGIGQLIAEHLHLRYGLSREEGRRHCFFMDSRGLVCASRTGLQHHKVGLLFGICGLVWRYWVHRDCVERKLGSKQRVRDCARALQPELGMRL